MPGPPWPDQRSLVWSEITFFALLSQCHSNLCLEVVAFGASLMLWLLPLQTASFDGPELAVNASVQAQTKTDRQLTLQREALGAQLTFASGACRLRASSHRGLTKVHGACMEVGPRRRAVGYKAAV